jgi:hypothetical protein
MSLDFIYMGFENASPVNLEGNIDEFRKQNLCGCCKNYRKN